MGGGCVAQCEGNIHDSWRPLTSQHRTTTSEINVILHHRTHLLVLDNWSHPAAPAGVCHPHPAGGPEPRITMPAGQGHLNQEPSHDPNGVSDISPGMSAAIPRDPRPTNPAPQSGCQKARQIPRTPFLIPVPSQSKIKPQQSSISPQSSFILHNFPSCFPSHTHSPHRQAGAAVPNGSLRSAPQINQGHNLSHET